MASPGTAIRGSTLRCLFVLGVLSAAAYAGDLSRYREFQFGADLPTVAKLAGMSPAQAQAIHRRPVLMQNLEWHPQPVNWSTKSESAQNVVFSFYGGELFRIAVDYDRHETEGLTAGDMVDAISAEYGTPTSYPAPTSIVTTPYGDQEEVLARWEAPPYCFDLIRSSYGPSFRLVGVQRKVEVAAQASSMESARLDELEAPQRDAARIAKEKEDTDARLAKARAVNKLKFRP